MQRRENYRDAPGLFCNNGILFFRAGFRCDFSSSSLLALLRNKRGLVMLDRERDKSGLRVTSYYNNEFAIIFFFYLMLAISAYQFETKDPSSSRLVITTRLYPLRYTQWFRELITLLLWDLFFLFFSLERYLKKKSIKHSKCCFIHFFLP